MEGFDFVDYRKRQYEDSKKDVSLALRKVWIGKEVVCVHYNDIVKDVSSKVSIGRRYHARLHTIR